MTLTIIQDEALRAIATAMPPQVRDEALPGILEALIEKDPGHWLTPISNHQCADLLGMTPGALAEARRTGHGPPGYGEIGGLRGKFYPSRSHVLNWVVREMEAAHMPPKRRLTATPARATHVAEMRAVA